MASEKCMTVGQLVAFLLQTTPEKAREVCKIHPDMPVMLSSDPEGNDFHPLDPDIGTGDWNGDVMADGDQGEAAPGTIRVLTLWAGYGEVAKWQK